MSDTKERLATAQWVFERQLAWISAAEVKLGVVVAIDTALLGGLAAAYSTAQYHSQWSSFLSILCVVGCCMALFCVAMAVLPRLRGPQKSLLFFGKVSELSLVAYVARFSLATDEELLDDWLAQVHRNAEIACLKHVWVRRSIGWSFISAPLWIVAIAMLVKF